jgi:hypothetical protein
MIVCPHCNATKSDEQPESGFHAWPVSYKCGFQITMWNGCGTDFEVELNCPNQKFEGYLSIRQFATEHDIELPKIDQTLNFSDLYVDIYKKCLDRKTHTWQSTSNEIITKHAMHYYNVNDLTNYFNNIK